MAKKAKAAKAAKGGRGRVKVIRKKKVRYPYDVAMSLLIGAVCLLAVLMILGFVAVIVFTVIL